MMRRLMLSLLLPLCPFAAAGGGGPVPALTDPVAALNAADNLGGVSRVTARAGYTVLRLELRVPPQTLEVMFANEAARADQAQQVRSVTLWAHVPQGQALSLEQVQALDRVTRELGAACLSQDTPKLTDVLRGLLGQPLPAPGVLQRFQNDLTLEVAEARSWEGAGTDLQVSMTLPEGAVPQCAMPGELPS
ncbi:hypothetical protein HNR42_001101 [Deinobacterium chartae]|uniref:Uncharacterized protein n=1 Tax=Deinobacterium chartae TaxID=521158 RepID=A0A841HYE8_9DEIO|nr:hypothetical protein [Deinobacterium chartae]MBB6097684.1 hypothetical protein [Deinobacterium chartae]